MKKPQRIFRDKFGRFTNDGRKVKTVQIGKRTYKKVDYVKKLFKKESKKFQGLVRQRKAKRPALRKIKVPEIFFKTETYQTQIGKLEKTHTVKFYRIILFEEIETQESFVQSFKDFYNSITQPEKATDVKFGIIAEDTETNQYISKYSQWTDLIFDEKAIEDLFNEIYDWVFALFELAERYMVTIKEAIITEIIMFKVKGHLK